MTTQIIAPASPLRFQELIASVDAGRFHNVAIEIALRLVTDVAVLHLADLRAAASNCAEAYRDGSEVFLEWPRGNGYIDRRVLSPRLADAIEAHGGAALKDAEWSTVVRELRPAYGSIDARNVWQSFLADACQWWTDHLPPALMGHVTRTKPFQPLPRSALARQAKLRMRQ